MNVQTFEASNMRDAVKAVKRALGADAVILSTREKSSEEGAAVEVTAAASTSKGADPGTLVYHGAGYRDPVYVDRHQRPNHLTQSPQTTGSSASGPSPDADPDISLENLAIRLGDLQSHLPNRRQVTAIEVGLAELKLILLDRLQIDHKSPAKDAPPPIGDIDRQLRLMGVDAGAVCDLVRHLKALPGPSTKEKKKADSPVEYYKSQAIRWMIKRIKIAPRWTLLSGSTSVQVFCGTTGVGKTTMVAKLAAFYKIREKKQVSVISFDNRRLAAADQMRVFTKVIGVPFRAVASTKELIDALNQEQDHELVLVDTAGRSPKEDSNLEDLMGLKDCGLPTEFHLTLSITEKELQLDRAVRAFAPLGIASLAFSKLDESWSFGEIFNISRRWTLPLSFFSIGQGVPDDIERATRERVIERIFGL